MLKKILLYCCIAILLNCFFVFLFFCIQNANLPFGLELLSTRVEALESKVERQMICKFTNMRIVNAAYAAEDERTYYQGIKVDQSYSGEVYLEPGKAMTFWVKYKNIGIYRWRDIGERTVYLKTDDSSGDPSASSGQAQKFYHQFWVDENIVSVLPARTEIGEYAIWRFALQAPSEPGEYLVKLRMWAYDDWVSGEDIQISVRVGWEEVLRQRELAEARLDLARQAEVLGIDSEGDGYIISNLQIPEPNIRVGLYSIDQARLGAGENKVQILSSGSYAIYGADGQLFLTQTQGEMTEIEFDQINKRYFINIGGKRMISSGKYFVFKQNDDKNIFTIVNYNNPAYAGSSVNYNKYRGSLEVQWIEDNEKLWVINELRMEDYLKGSGESMDISPYEFLKAMAVAERTYAMFHYVDPTKHNIRNFTVAATQSDQIYQGYGREILQPNICRAVDDSIGLIVIYNNEPALTLYFSQSNGQTKSYEEVYKHKSYPYLISVSDEHMAGNQQIGHGVGMSARGALFKASRDGDSFSDLLRHYYTGVEVNKVY